MADQPPSSAFLTMLNESLSFAPERSDLWMARFDVLRSLGYKREFGQLMVEAEADPRIRRAMEWDKLREMWEEIAPGESFPVDAEERLQPAAPAPAAAPIADRAAPRAARRRPAAAPPGDPRRFNDIAVKLAGAELAALARDYNTLTLKPGFFEDFTRKSRALLMRPTPLEYSESLTRGAGYEKRIYLKREDRRGMPVEAEHAAAQCYIGSLIGKSSIVTANDVDLHALETVTAASFFGQKCTVVVRAGDMQAKRALVEEMTALGGQVVAMPASGMLSTDPREGAVRLWQKNISKAHLVLSLGMAPAPYMLMANAFQALLGRETLTQYTEMASLLNRPRTLIAAIGSEADSIGFVLPFLNSRDIRVAYAEPEPGGIASWRPSERFKPYNGQIREHSWLLASGRIQHVAVPDTEATATREHLAREGIRISFEDARAVALAKVLGHGDPTPRDFLVLVG